MAPTTIPASSGALVTRFTTPLPRPASTKLSTIKACVRGQRSEALSTTVFPQANGVAIARVPRMMGAFHGAIPSTTPAGSRRASAMQPGLSDGITSPPICVVRAAASRTMSTASFRLKRAQPSVAPTSLIIASTKVSPRAAILSAAKLRAALLTVGPNADQAASAIAAASAAAVASPTVNATAVDATAPVTGLRRSNVAVAVARSVMGLHQRQICEGRPESMHLKGVAEWENDASAFLHGQRVDDYQLAAHVLQVMHGAQKVAVPFCRIRRVWYEGRLLKNVSRTRKIGLNRAFDHVEPSEAVDRT